MGLGTTKRLVRRVELTGATPLPTLSRKGRGRNNQRLAMTLRLIQRYCGYGRVGSGLRRRVRVVPIPSQGRFIFNETTQGEETPGKRGVGQRSATETRTPLTTEITEITERIPGRSVRGIHSDPRPIDPLGQLAAVDLILLGLVSLLRILLSVVSVISVVPRSSCLPESSPRLGAPALRSWQAGAVPFTARFAVWWVALPWPILPVPTVLLALCRVVVHFRRVGAFEPSPAGSGGNPACGVGPKAG